MTATPSNMRLEIEEIPHVVDRLLSVGFKSIDDTAAAIAQHDPSFLISVARGSSDHVCTYLKYASELLLGLTVASIGPSVASLYGAKLRLPNNVCISVSQSGKSPDIVELTRSVRQQGSYTVAITNDTDSPLAQTAEATLTIHAGQEISVAATKTCVSSLITGLTLFARWKQDNELLDVIYQLPELLAQAIACDWSALTSALTGNSLYVLGRGPSWAIANESALKFKEVCQIHAESYSSAEVLHGPVSLVDRGFTIIGFAAADAAESSVVKIADQIAGTSAHVFVTSSKAKRARQLEHVRSDHWLIDPVLLLVSFYAMIEQFATDRNINPDKPRHLQKVTETV